MPALKNAKHEAFAQGLFKGLSATDAYGAAGYKGDRTAASRLSTNVNVRNRVAELQERASEKAEWSAADRLRTLSEIAGRTATTDPRVAVSAISEANKMQGSHAPTKSEVKATVQSAHDLSDDELAAIAAGGSA